MKPITLALAFFCVSASAATSQNAGILACQYLDSNGFRSENGRWLPTQFETNKPFFLRTVGGKLDESSVAEFLGGSDVKCVTPSFDNRTETCMDSLGGSLHYSHSQNTGAEAQLFGAGQSEADDRRDTVTVSIFTCQHM